MSAELIGKRSRSDRNRLTLLIWARDYFKRDRAETLATLFGNHKLVFDL